MVCVLHMPCACCWYAVHMLHARACGVEVRKVGVCKDPKLGRVLGVSLGAQRALPYALTAHSSLHVDAQRRPSHGSQHSQHESQQKQLVYESAH